MEVRANLNRELTFFNIFSLKRLLSSWRGTGGDWREAEIVLFLHHKLSPSFIQPFLSKKHFLITELTLSLQDFYKLENAQRQQHQIRFNYW